MRITERLLSVAQTQAPHLFSKVGECGLLKSDVARASGWCLRKLQVNHWSNSKRPAYDTMEHIPRAESLNARADWNLILWGRLDLWPLYLTLYSEFVEVRHAQVLSGFST